MGFNSGFKGLSSFLIVCETKTNTKSVIYDKNEPESQSEHN